MRPCYCYSLIWLQENKAPCRFGFVLSVPPEGSASQSQSASWPKQLPRDAFADFVGQDEATPSDSSEQGEESPQALIILAFSYFEEEFDNNVDMLQRILIILFLSYSFCFSAGCEEIFEAAH